VRTAIPSLRSQRQKSYCSTACERLRGEAVKKARRNAVTKEKQVEHAAQRDRILEQVEHFRRQRRQQRLDFPRPPTIAESAQAVHDCRVRDLPPSYQTVPCAVCACRTRHAVICTLEQFVHLLKPVRVDKHVSSTLQPQSIPPELAPDAAFVHDHPGSGNATVLAHNQRLCPDCGLHGFLCVRDRCGSCGKKKVAGEGNETNLCNRPVSEESGHGFE